jgi:predicted amidohydrolase
MLRIGSCQTPEILGDVEAALACIEGFGQEADQRGIDLLLFPECFLQGYLVETAHLRDHAVALDSASLQSVLDRLRQIRSTLVVGMIERHGEKYFNTAVVLRAGHIVGAYRKTHLSPGEALFDAGDSYPVFELHGVRYGINICFDTNFPEAAAPVAAQGARLLLVPAQNMMRRQAAEEWKLRHNQIRAERVRETGMWLVSADVTGERGNDYVAYGPTSVMSPTTQVVAQVPPMTVGMVEWQLE